MRKNMFSGWRTISLCNNVLFDSDCVEYRQCGYRERIAVVVSVTLGNNMIYTCFASICTCTIMNLVLFIDYPV